MAEIHRLCIRRANLHWDEACTSGAYLWPSTPSSPWPGPTGIRLPEPKMRVRETEEAKKPEHPASEAKSLGGRHSIHHLC